MNKVVGDRNFRDFDRMSLCLKSNINYEIIKVKLLVKLKINLVN